MEDNNDLNPEENSEESYREEADRIFEIMTSEIEEWSRVIEDMETPEERRVVIEAIFTINEWDKTLPLLGSNLEKAEEIKQAINSLRANFGLPPKYSI